MNGLRPFGSGSARFDTTTITKIPTTASTTTTARTPTRTSASEDTLLLLADRTPLDVIFFSPQIGPCRLPQSDPSTGAVPGHPARCIAFLPALAPRRWCSDPLHDRFGRRRERARWSKWCVRWLMR